MKKGSDQTLELQKKEITFLFEEAIPLSENERKQYVADISLFYSKIFKNKLKHFVGLQLEALGQVGRSPEEYDIYRANANCFRLISEWMETRTNEHFGNLEELRSKSSDDKEFINNFKETYGKI